MTARRLSIAQQNSRRAQLDAIRSKQSLTDREEAELERLETAFYMRTWRQQQREIYGKAINVLPVSQLRETAA